MLKKQSTVVDYSLLRKRTLRLFLITTIVSFLCFQIGKNSFLINMSYSLHEFVSGMTNLLFFTPILFMFYVFFTIKHIQSTKPKFKRTKRIVPTILLLATVLSIYTVFYYQLHDMTSSGILPIDFKTQEENNYYLWIDDKKISTSQDIYDGVKVKEEYHGSFSWNSLNPEKGKLISIRNFR
ncbi:hypothetical protein [Planococcus sp. CAU13]|uniref:hypothetical protein n=1 Tax=Planococcus sp. CAU13 TaxID=1541197 RepID=UPI00052FEF8B|nr:hypothetical protein [Planococcus sp. CAU13]